MLSWGFPRREGDRVRYSAVTYVSRGGLSDGSVVASVFVVVVVVGIIITVVNRSVVVIIIVHVVVVATLRRVSSSTFSMLCRPPLEDHPLWTSGSEISCYYCCCYCCWDY